MGQHKLSTDDVKGRVKQSLSQVEYDALVANTEFKHNDWVLKAFQLNLLSEYEEESMLPMKYTVIKAYLWSHLKNTAMRSCIDEIVVLTSLMYSVGTRFVGGWALENESRFKEPSFYDDTLGDVTFLKHSFRGVIDKGTLHPLISESRSFKIVQSMYPPISKLTEVLPSLTAWNNIIGSIAILYKQSIRLHVCTHMWARMLAHMRRFTCDHLGAKIVSATVDSKTEKYFKVGDTLKMSISSVYAGFTDETARNKLPDAMRKELEHILSHFALAEITKFPKMPKNINGNIFRLHLYLRSCVPVVIVQVVNPVQNHIVNPATSELEAVPKNTQMSVDYHASKGWSPVPISKMGRVHVTIDQSKVLPALVHKFNLPEESTIETIFGLDTISLKDKHRVKRRSIRKHRRTVCKNRHSKTRARMSTVCNGMGIFKLLSKNKNCKPRSIMTDGVSLCIRYGTLITKKSSNNTPTETLAGFVSRTNAILCADDPGRVNLAQLTKRYEKGYRHMRFTRVMYKSVGLSTRIQAERTKRKHAAPDVMEMEALLADAGGWKARNEDGYLNALRVFRNHGQCMLEHYGQKEYTKFKMLSYRRTQSVIMQRFANFIDVDNKNVHQKHSATQGIVLGIGNASFAPTGKGETSVPTTRMAKLFDRYLNSRNIPHRLESVDEYCSTKNCHGCGNELTTLRDKETHYVIRGLKSCCHCGTITDPIFLNRDANAAINLLLCLEAMVAGKDRPQHLQRPKQNKRKTTAKESHP